MLKTPLPCELLLIDEDFNEPFENNFITRKVVPIYQYFDWGFFNTLQNHFLTVSLLFSVFFQADLLLKIINTSLASQLQHQQHEPRFDEDDEEDNLKDEFEEES